MYGPFKRAYSREIDSWLVSNAGKTVSIYELAELSGKAWPKARTPANIKGGFVSADIHPFQRDKWTDDDFCLAQVTDRPNLQGDNDGTFASTSAIVGSIQVIADSPQVADEVPVTHSEIHLPIPLTIYHRLHRRNILTFRERVVLLVTGNVASELSRITPESVRPFPKAAPRKAGVARKKLSSEIFTSTPVKKGIAHTRT